MFLVYWKLDISTGAVQEALICYNRMKMYIITLSVLSQFNLYVKFSHNFNFSLGWIWSSFRMKRKMQAWEMVVLADWLVSHACKYIQTPLSVRLQ